MSAVIHPNASIRRTPSSESVFHVRGLDGDRTHDLLLRPAQNWVKPASLDRPLKPEIPPFLGYRVSSLKPAKLAKSGGHCYRSVIDHGPESPPKDDPDTLRLACSFAPMEDDGIIIMWHRKQTDARKLFDVPATKVQNGRAQLRASSPVRRRDPPVARGTSHVRARVLAQLA